MEKKLKILHINTGLVAGGVERLLDDLLPLFKLEKNIEIELFLLENKNNFFEKSLEKNGIKIIFSKYNNKFDLRNIFEIRKLIRKYDVIHSHIFPSQFYVPISLIGIRKKPYLITTEHNTDNNRRKYNFLSKIEKYLYLKYNKVISISLETEIELKKWLRIGEKYKEKFIIIENGINLNKFSIKKENIEKNFFEKERKNKIITMIGRFDKQKDQPTLIKAIRNLEDISLLLVGDGVRREEYEKLAKEYEVENKIKFLGIRSDVPKILAITDICVLSSNWEGFGLAAIEGMATGKPLIASDVDGLKQIVEGAGITFEKGNHKELEKELYKLIKDKEFYNKVAIKCQERAKKYDIKLTFDKYLKLYMLKE